MAKVVNNPTICKATIFVGLNDKENKLQEISTLDAAKFIQREIVKEFEGGTISEATNFFCLSAYNVERAAADFRAAGVEFDGGKAYQIRKAGRGVVVEYRHK